MTGCNHALCNQTTSCSLENVARQKGQKNAHNNSQLDGMQAQQLMLLRLFFFKLQSEYLFLKVYVSSNCTTQ
jgi:hypothetical protein